MTRGDAAVESAADKLDRFVRSARTSGGVKGKVGQALSDDPDFLRKLKPTLMAARARGQAPPSPTPAREPIPPAGPPRPRSGPSPWLVLGVALVAGYTIARVIDWRGHAHPRH